MDPCIWCRLPAELLEHVLSFLPLKSFLSLRTTCKRFRSLIFSPSFISKHASSSSPFSSFLLLSHPHLGRLKFPLYDTARGTWRKLFLSISLLLPPSAPSSLVCTSKGLLCFSLPNSYSFLICNLLANSSREIDFPTFPFAFETLTLVSTPIGYTIFMITTSGGSSSSLSTFVYNSRSNSWQQFECFDPILNSDNHQEGVFSNGCLYFTTSQPFSVVSFDLGMGNWGISIAELPSELTFIRLASDGEGKLFMIGGIGRNGISRSMKVWELEEGGGKWVELASSPEGMCKKLMSVCYHNYEHVYCFWHQGMVCVCCYTWPEVLYYKMSRRTWHWLPKCPSLPEKWSCGFRWFSFVPELYAFA